MYPDQIQPVILAAGRGSRMNQLLGTSVIKCLVPVHGFPLIYYPLKLLSDSGLPGKGVLVIIQENHKDEIKRAIDKLNDKLPNVHVEYFLVSEESDDFGPCESLRLALTAKKITRDVLLLSCDTIANIPLKELFHFNQINESDCTALFLKNLSLQSGTRLPGPKKIVKQEKDIVGMDPVTKQLVFMASEADFDENLSFPMIPLKSSPHVKLYTSYIDSHIYMLRKSLLEELTKKNFISFKGEFIPYLINTQFNDGGITEGGNPSPRKLHCFLEPNKECTRVNSTMGYLTISKSFDFVRRAFGAEVNKNFKADKTVKLQSTVVGEGCEFGEKVKLVNCILMNNIEIEAGTVLENCVVSSGARIGSKSILKECLVGPKFRVGSEGSFTNDFMNESFFEA